MATDDTRAASVPASWTGPAAHRRVLLVVSEPVDRAQVHAILGGDPPRSVAVLVVAPALQRSGLRYWVSDTDEGTAHARDVEAATLAELRRDGVPNDGHVGADDPLTAIEDALRFFDADEVVIAMHAAGRRRYREGDLRADVERRFGIPAAAIDPPAGS
jgi:hypothetical protein